MPAAMALELAMMTVVLDRLSWPTGLAVAAICRAWCAETADVIRASAWKWQVPLPNEGSPGMLLRALYRGIGLADLVRMRTASTFERFEEGLRVAVFGAVGQWANLPPLCVSRCPAEWEKLPEEAWWLARKGTGHTWRFQRFYVDIGVPRHEMMQERWTLEVFVERFCLQISKQESEFVTTVASPASEWMEEGAEWSEES